MLFLIKIFYDDDKKLIYMIDFLCLNQRFTTKHIKTVKNSRFFYVKKNLNTSIFLKASSKVATLMVF